MEKIAEKLDASHLRLTVNFNKDEVEKAVSNRMTFLRRNAVIPGFRKGKAPSSLIIRHIGKQAITKQAVGNLVDENLSQYVNSDDFDRVTDPELIDLVINEDGGASVTFEFEVMPEVDLGKLDEINFELQRDSLEPTSEEIENAVADILRGYTTLEIKEEPSTNGDYLYIEVINSGLGKNEIDAKNYLVNDLDYLLVRVLPGDYGDLQKRFIGLKPSDVIELDPGSGRYGVIDKVFKPKLPELTDIWVKENTSFESLDEFNEFVSSVVKTRIKRQLIKEAETKVLDFINQNYQFELPHSLQEMLFRAKVALDQLNLQRQGFDLSQIYKQRNLLESFLNSVALETQKELRAYCVGYNMAKLKRLKPSDQEVIQLASLMLEAQGSKPDRQAYSQAMSSAYILSQGSAGWRWIISHSKLSFQGGNPVDSSIFGYEFEFLSDEVKGKEVDKLASEPTVEQTELKKEANDSKLSSETNENVSQEELQ